ncbi:MAG TPA: hypothetical protein PK891_00285 [Bacteroidales bacterium]|nr:hypothetical protein [Bacteroidales bacterium]
MVKKKDNQSENQTARSAEEFQKNLPDIAKRYSLRISKPYGYFPEDVHNIITSLEEQANRLAKENTKLTEEADTAKKQLKDISTEFRKFKMKVQFMSFEQTTEEEELAMIEEGMSSISSNNEAEAKPKIKLNSIKLNGKSGSESHKSTFNNLIQLKQDENDGG